MSLLCYFPSFPSLGLDWSWALRAENPELVRPVRLAQGRVWKPLGSNPYRLTDIRAATKPIGGKLCLMEYAISP